MRFANKVEIKRTKLKVIIIPFFFKIEALHTNSKMIFFLNSIILKLINLRISDVQKICIFLSIQASTCFGKTYLIGCFMEHTVPSCAVLLKVCNPTLKVSFDFFFHYT